MTPIDDIENAPERVAEGEPLDVRVFARAMCEEAYSIQKLLHEYTDKTRALDEEVRGFVERDNAEEDALQLIVTDVAHAEMRALRNVRYVEFLQQRSGTLAEEAAEGAVVCPASADGRSCGYVAGCLAALCNGAPDSVFDLGKYGDVVEVLLGWRSATSTSRAQLDALCASIFGGAPDISMCVLLVNGFLYTPCGTGDAHKLAEKDVEAATVEGGSVVAEEVLVQWLDAVVMHSLLTGNRLRDIFEAAGAMERSEHWLVGDGHDTLSIVVHTRLLHSAVFRGFFFSGQLRGVESVGAQANLMFPLFGVTGSESQRRVERRVVDVFESLQRQEGRPLSACKNAAVLLAVQGDVLAASDGALPLRFVVLDIRPLAPSLPFTWHFTWAEICALGQLDTAPGVGDGSVPLPVFKTTRVAVASLEPYDALSREAFPALNGYLRGARLRRRSATGSTRFTAAAAAAAAGAALVLAAVFVGRLYFGSRRG
ncbi:hypothetical protein TRSC58_02905 [Trypanosoma rangeli SC58]|uniref:Uncharacterized protein n=1 Tax=Trypanosoma rangeli SC58 TaxID=429131 RepID=A0A061J1S8_TRYRA|nr:hypothetical protein TRSC58_02905 [Trypanosoma rangeli SC58]